jgi:NAD(P) transhydrogenase subunit alpha
MKLAVLKETANGETRVAATPETVKKFKSLGLEVVVQAGAGNGARIADADYAAAGATIAPDMNAALSGADIVLKVRGFAASETPQLKRGAVVAALLAPHSEKESIARLAGHRASSGTRRCRGSPCPSGRRPRTG